MSQAGIPQAGIPQAGVRGEALETALRALRHRDLSEAELGRRLAARGFDEVERAEALETLRRTSVIDDRRFAESRAGALSDRGAGDALIRHDLERAGVEAELVEDVVDALAPEAERARRIVKRRGADPRTGRYLRSKGFSEDVVGPLIATRSEDELG